MSTQMSLRDLEDGRVGPFLRSRKNRVFRTSYDGREYVVKVFRGEWRERAPVEFGVLTDCRERGLPAPLPVALLEDAIVMEPVGGEPAADLFDRLFTSGPSPLTEGQKGLAESIIAWLSRFHSAFDFKLARGDTILRNFMLSPGVVVGLDFEEALRGEVLVDLGQLCASALMTDPPFTEIKIAFAKHLADCYWERTGRDRSDELDRHVSSAIRHYAPFRANGTELLGYASWIDMGGLRIG